MNSLVSFISAYMYMYILYMYTHTCTYLCMYMYYTCTRMYVLITRCFTIVMPCGWCLEKVASLLVKSGDALSKAVMGNRALNGHTEELSLMLYHIAHCCFNPRIISMAASVSVGYNGKDMTTLRYGHTYTSLILV